MSFSALALLSIGLFIFTLSVLTQACRWFSDNIAVLLPILCFMFLAAVGAHRLWHSGKSQVLGLFITITEKMLTDKDCIQAQTMLTFRKTGMLSFRGETDEYVETMRSRLADKKIQVLKANKEGRVDTFNTFELLLALDTHLHAECYWQQNGGAVIGNITFHYQTDMRLSMEKFALWLSYVEPICADGFTVPPALRLFIDLLDLPVSDESYVDILDAIVRLFVWRRLLLDSRVVATALATAVFGDRANHALTLSWWFDAILVLATKEGKRLQNIQTTNESDTAPLISAQLKALNDITTAIHAFKASGCTAVLSEVSDGTVFPPLNAMIEYARAYRDCDM